jgi:prepilin-type N-terminal cleavage/methylation domain-containing protein
MKIKIQNPKPEIRNRRAFGLRWQSEAATPLFAGLVCSQRRRGASLPAALQSAFTLVELMLVVTIIGILAALVIPKIAGKGE